MSSIDRSEVFVEFEIVRTGLSGTMPKGNPTAVPALTRNQLIAELKQLESSLGVAPNISRDRRQYSRPAR